MRHQSDALNKGAAKREFAYFMEPGTGKSKVLLDDAAINFNADRIDALVILCPKSMRFAWSDKQVPEHCAVNCTTIVWPWPKVKNASDARSRVFTKDPTALAIFIFNIDAVNSDKGHAAIAHVLKSYRCMFAVDESSRIKHSSAQRTKKIINLGKSAVMRRILTGTPVTQGYIDLYSQTTFLNRGLCGHTTLTSFRARHCVMGGFENRQILDYNFIDDLMREIEPNTFFMKRDDCLDLPGQTFETVPFDLSPAERRSYDELKTELMTQIRDDLIAVDNPLSKLMRLQQIASGINPADAYGSTIGNDKPARLETLLDLLEDLPTPVIIWARFIPERAMILKALGARCLDLSACEDPESEFQNGDWDYAVGNPQGSGIGLTLTRATTAVYYSRDFNYENRRQSEDRIYRIGQTHKVTYYDLVARSTIDVKNMAALAKKANMAIATMSGAEFRDLVSDEPKAIPQRHAA